jgi:hypothetical protein
MTQSYSYDSAMQLLDENYQCLDFKREAPFGSTPIGIACMLTSSPYEVTEALLLMARREMLILHVGCRAVFKHFNWIRPEFDDSLSDKQVHHMAGLWILNEDLRLVERGFKGDTNFLARNRNLIESLLKK